MTFLEIINAVLRRLREDEVVSTNSTAYSKLIGDFVNQAIHDCEHAWDWNALKEMITITTVSGTDLYDFHNADVKILSAINDDKDWHMRVITDEYHFKLEYISSPQVESPFFYSFRGSSSGYSQIKLWPEPTAAENIRFLTIKYTPRKALDGTDDTDEISIPDLPVILHAYSRAVSERGEDGGVSINQANLEYRNALADSIALDAAMIHPTKVDWHVV